MGGHPQENHWLPINSSESYAPLDLPQIVERLREEDEAKSARALAVLHAKDVQLCELQVVVGRLQEDAATRELQLQMYENGVLVSDGMRREQEQVQRSAMQHAEATARDEMLSKQLEASAEEMERLRLTVASLEAANLGLEAAKVAAEAAAGTARHELGEQGLEIRRMHAEREAHAEALRDLESREARLYDVVESTVAEEKATQRQIQKRDEQIQRRGKQIEQRDEQIELRDEQIRALQASLASKDAQLVHAQQAAAAALKRADAAESRADATHQELTARQQLLANTQDALEKAAATMALEVERAARLETAASASEEQLRRARVYLDTASEREAMQERAHAAQLAEQQELLQRMSTRLCSQKRRDERPPLPPS